ncbi:RHS repeat-associated core domain protein [Bernardetia litoralis DSM 6794]|uniref:RHS repeat-associated core domain protein n=1 Tax=Bernardetia litoralis (strain ATCC 23117 / DSM 6794 / NBRC 15988 / NCIMB 1366 / Fx l1 / Sio-4) TaxID=880071 RepID=I4AFC0_BERLS|nr:RHS repeat-associated core domain-containing protein [Bernardetia litoralis]AFM02655.1 RHS repeat-associated core domain protein [Bernardetia litoralis DSM 6794]
MQLRDSTDSLIVEKRQKITISATVSWQKLVSELTIEQDGNLTVFIDNQDTEAVYFDNLELRVESDPTLVITQEQHYYPFGMNMSGIERDGELKYQFNGMIEREEAFGLELYETPFRSYDAQLGRFWQVEPLADEFHSISMFQFAFNNPISANDPSGLRTIYTLKGPQQRKGLSEFISAREAREKIKDNITTGIQVVMKMVEDKNYLGEVFIIIWLLVGS